MIERVDSKGAKAYTRTMEEQFPELFRERYAQLSESPEEFFAALSTPLPRTGRVNTLKATVEQVRERFAKYGLPYEPAPWYAEAFTTSSAAVSRTLEHFIGAIYLQDYASMLPPLVVKEELQTAELVLDACAAPGSKTTQMAALMRNRGTIVANDVEYQRIKALKFNCEKTGVFNAAITNFDLRDYPACEFDVVLLDAPCTSEGTIRKDRKIVQWWSMNYVYGTAQRQKQLILRSFDLLARGGVMIYSTCTFAPEENEEVVDYLLRNREATLEAINVPNFRLIPGLTQWRDKSFDARLSLTARVLPQHNDTGGFFLARIRK